MKNKKIPKSIMIPTIVIIVCAITALFVWKLQYHGESPDYVSTQKKINQNKAKTKEQFKKIKQDSFPTVQQANQYLIDQTGKKDLNGVSLDKLKSLLKDKYGTTAANALLSGLCLSQDMTPEQESSQEVRLAQLDKNQKGYVGFAYRDYTTSVYDPSSIDDNGKTRFPVNVYTAAPSDKLSWTKDGDFQLSTPIAMDLSVKKNDKYCTMLIFIKVPSGDDTSFNDFKNEMQSINLKVNGEKLDLSGSHEETKTSEESQGMQFTKSPGAKNDMYVYDSDKIFQSSVVPVTFDLPLSDIEKGMKVDLNGIDQGDYQFKSSNTYRF